MQLLAEAVFAVHEGGSIPQIPPPHVPHPNSKSPVHDSHPAMFSMQESSWIRDYQIMESIGQGGMGSVFRAMHVRLDKLVAIKVLKSDRIDSPDNRTLSTASISRLLGGRVPHPASPSVCSSHWARL
jgi:serine/threonine protein kinase